MDRSVKISPSSPPPGEERRKKRASERERERMTLIGRLTRGMDHPEGGGRDFARSSGCLGGLLCENVRDRFCDCI